MSQPQAQRGSFINILLFGAIAFLGWQLIVMPQQQNNADTRKPEEVLAKMRENSALLLDLTVQREQALYFNKVKDKKFGVSPELVEEKELESLVLVSHTKLKSALYRKKIDTANANFAFDKLNRAFETIKPKFESLHTKELWQKKFAVVGSEKLGLPESEISAGELYQKLTAELSDVNRTHMVWGLFQGYRVIDFLVTLTGSNPGFSYWFAAFLLALCVRIIVWPLAMKQYLWGRQMGQLQPYIAEIKERFTDKKTGQISDQNAFTQETFKLYKEYGINPMAGCGPAVIQLPFFLFIYQCMLHYRFEFTKGSFLWIHPGATSFLGIPLAPNLGERDYIMIALYGVTMVLATLMAPVSDPNNAKQSRLMGVGIAVFFSIVMFFWPLPSAFVVYWTFTNILSSAMSVYAYRVPLPPLQKKVTVKGGLIPEADGPGQIKAPVNPGFFGKTATPKTIKPKKKKS